MSLLTEMKEKLNIENCSWDLMAKYLNHEANEEDIKLMETWLDSSKANRKDLNISKDLLEKTRIYYQSRRFDRESAWNHVQLSLNQHKTIALKQPHKSGNKAMKTIFKYAAAIVLISVLGSLAYYFGFQANSYNLNKIASLEKQVLKEVVLPDGSLVTLNSSSVLTYPSSFEGNTRKVSIEGEAFFDITPNTAKPFIINAGQARIKVLGTSFNVNAYPGIETVEVVVKTGKVEVSNNKGEKNGHDQLVLLPGEKGILHKTNNKLQKSINENPNYSAWFTHDFIFDNAQMDEVIQCLNKTYQTSIQTVSPEINSLKLTAHFTDQSVDYILEVIRLTFNLELRVENEQYLLSSHHF